MDEMEHLTKTFARLVGDPLVDAVRGTVRIVSVNEPRGRWPYQDCRLEVVTDAAGVAPRTVTVEAAVARKHWPRVGQVLPAMIAPDNDAIDIDWAALTR